MNVSRLCARLCAHRNIYPRVNKFIMRKNAILSWQRMAAPDRKIRDSCTFMRELVDPQHTRAKVLTQIKSPDVPPRYRYRPLHLHVIVLA